MCKHEILVQTCPKCGAENVFSPAQGQRPVDYCPFCGTQLFMEVAPDEPKP